MLRLQRAPGVSEKLLVQSAGVPEPGTWRKFVPTIRPGAMAVSGWLPTFWMVTDCGALVVPTAIFPKSNVAGGEPFTSSSGLLLIGPPAKKRLPAASNASG